MSGTALFEMLTVMFPLLLMVICALGLYAFGKWLRGRGHGEQLDAMAVFITRLQRKSNAVLVPLAVGIGRLGHSFSRLPLLGSKQQQQQWDELESRIREDKMYTRL